MLVKCRFVWSGRRVSNSRPQPWQGCALPTELLPHTKPALYPLLLLFGGAKRNRTAVNGFAIRCITTLLSRRHNFHSPAWKHWSGRRVSNSRPQPWQGCALPTELLPQRRMRILQTRTPLSSPRSALFHKPRLRFSDPFDSIRFSIVRARSPQPRLPERPGKGNHQPLSDSGNADERLLEKPGRSAFSKRRSMRGGRPMSASRQHPPPHQVDAANGTHGFDQCSENPKIFSSAASTARTEAASSGIVKSDSPLASCSERTGS